VRIVDAALGDDAALGAALVALDHVYGPELMSAA
jgi:hypothetical protein